MSYAERYENAFVVTGPMVVYGQDKRVARGFCKAFAAYDATAWTYDLCCLYPDALVGMIVYKIDALAFVGLYRPRKLLRCCCGVICRESKAGVTHDIGIFGAVGVAKSGLQ